MSKSPRTGMAPIEFIMVLVVLLPVFAFLLWTGAWYFAQAQLTIDVRAETWKKRFGAPARLAFNYDGMSGRFSTGPTSRDPYGIPRWTQLPQPTSSHVVLGGSWGHDQVSLNKRMNWGLVGQLAVDAVRLKTERVGHAIDGLTEIDVGKEIRDRLEEKASQPFEIRIPGKLGMAAEWLGITFEIPKQGTKGSKRPGNSREDEAKRDRNAVNAKKLQQFEEMLRGKSDGSEIGILRKIQVLEGKSTGIDQEIANNDRRLQEIQREIQRIEGEIRQRNDQLKRDENESDPAKKLTQREKLELMREIQDLQRTLTSLQNELAKREEQQIMLPMEKMVLEARLEEEKSRKEAVEDAIKRLQNEE